MEIEGQLHVLASKVNHTFRAKSGGRCRSSPMAITTHSSLLKSYFIETSLRGTSNKCGYRLVIYNARLNLHPLHSKQFAPKIRVKTESHLCSLHVTLASCIQTHTCIISSLGERAAFPQVFGSALLFLLFLIGRGSRTTERAHTTQRLL